MHICNPKCISLVTPSASEPCLSTFSLYTTSLHYRSASTCVLKFSTTNGLTQSHNSDMLCLDKAVTDESNVQQRKVNKEKQHSKSTILLKQIIIRLLIGQISFLIFPTLAVLSGLNYPNSLTFTTNFRLFSIPRDRILRVMQPTCTNNYKRCGFSPHELTTHIPVLTTLSYCVQSRYICVTGLFVMSELAVFVCGRPLGESKHKSGREGNSGTAAINRKEKIDYHRHPHSSSTVNDNHDNRPSINRSLNQLRYIPRIPYTKRCRWQITSLPTILGSSLYSVSSVSSLWESLFSRYHLPFDVIDDRFKK